MQKIKTENFLPHKDVYGVRWCTPVIPAAWETEAGGLQVQSQPPQLVEALNNFMKTGLKIKKNKIKRPGDVAQWLSTSGFNYCYHNQNKTKKKKK